MTQSKFEAVDNYIANLLGYEDDALKAVHQSIIDSGIPSISVSPNQGKLLHVFAKIANAKNILELGTLAGYSTIWMARALPKDGRLITLEYDPKHAAIAQKNLERAGVADQVEIRTGAALDILPLLQAEGVGPFDMIFIDADKPPYAEYFQWALRLSRPGTLIIADNVIRDGKVIHEAPSDEMVAGVQRFNNVLGANEDVVATIVQMVGTKEHDGMAIAVVK